MSLEDTKILEFNQYQNSGKETFTIYADLECIKEKIDGCKNNPGNSSTIKVSEHISSGFSISAISSFRSIENKLDVYRDKDCMKRFCEFSRKHLMQIIIIFYKNEVTNKEHIIFVKKNLKINI